MSNIIQFTGSKREEDAGALLTLTECLRGALIARDLLGDVKRGNSIFSCLKEAFADGDSTLTVPNSLWDPVQLYLDKEEALRQKRFREVLGEE